MPKKTSRCLRDKEDPHARRYCHPHVRRSSRRRSRSKTAKRSSHRRSRSKTPKRSKTSKRASHRRSRSKTPKRSYRKRAKHGYGYKNRLYGFGGQPEPGLVAPIAPRSRPFAQLPYGNDNKHAQAPFFGMPSPQPAVIPAPPMVPFAGQREGQQQGQRLPGQLPGPVPFAFAGQGEGQRQGQRLPGQLPPPVPFVGQGQAEGQRQGQRIPGLLPAPVPFAGQGQGQAGAFPANHDLLYDTSESENESESDSDNEGRPTIPIGPERGQDQMASPEGTEGAEGQTATTLLPFGSGTNRFLGYGQPGQELSRIGASAGSSASAGSVALVQPPPIVVPNVNPIQQAAQNLVDEKRNAAIVNVAAFMGADPIAVAAAFAPPPVAVPAVVTPPEPSINADVYPDQDLDVIYAPGVVGSGRIEQVPRNLGQFGQVPVAPEAPPLGQIGQFGRVSQFGQVPVAPEAPPLGQIGQFGRVSQFGQVPVAPEAPLELPASPAVGAPLLIPSRVGRPAIAPTADSDLIARLREQFPKHRLAIAGQEGQDDWED